jgi:parvulin-like peptidyl-prolyl isomerase
MRRLFLTVSFLLLPTLGALAGCTKLTEPVSDRSSASSTPRPIETVAKPIQRAPQPEAPGEGAEAEATVTASHILIAYQGAMRSRATRTKEEAKKRADELLARAKKGENFGTLATENSDDPSAKMNQGNLGAFTKGRMVKPFADAAFTLAPGQISDLVETPFGYHIIRREQ